MAVHLLTSDLMIGSQVSAAAARTGVDLHTSSSSSDLMGSVGEHPSPMVVIDLALPGLDIADLLQKLAENEQRPARVIAFGPHVSESLLNTAKAAGCDEVYTRGQFHSKCVELLGSIGR